MVSISLHTCSATVILISSVWRHMALVSFTSMWSWLAVLLLKLDNKQPKQGWIWYQEWGTKKWNIGFYVGIFLEMYSAWGFWTKETGLALRTSVFSTETTLDSVFHLLAYQNFHKLFYEWETNNFSRSGNWDTDSYMGATRKKIDPLQLRSWKKGEGFNLQESRHDLYRCKWTTTRITLNVTTEIKLLDESAWTYTWSLISEWRYILSRLI